MTTTRKERHTIYEAAAIAAAGFGLAFGVPTLVSAHDSVALLAALILVVAWIVWLTYFGYRTLDHLSKHKEK